MVVEHELVKIKRLESHIEEIDELGATLSVCHVINGVSEVQFLLVCLISNRSSSCLSVFPLLLHPILLSLNLFLSMIDLTLEVRLLLDLLTNDDRLILL